MNKKIVDKLFKMADKSLKKNEFPVAAIVFKDDRIISIGYNKRNKSHNTIDHAEIIAIQKANKKLKSWRLQECSMLVTLEPCEMCKSVIKEARLQNVYYYVERYNYKKQYSRTNFNYVKEESGIVSNYIHKIKSFFR